MAKVSIHKPSGREPFHIKEMSVQDCAAQFDLQEVCCAQSLGIRAPSAAPESFGTNLEPGLILAERLPDEQTVLNRPGYYASRVP